MAGVIALVHPGAAYAQTEAPGFVYAQALRGHVIVVNWETPLDDVTEDITYRIYRAEGSTRPAFPGSGAYPGNEWTLAGTTDKRWKNSFLDDEPKANSARYWYVVTADNGTDSESLASPVNSPAYGGVSGLQRDWYLPSNDASSYQDYIGPYTLPPLEPTNIRLSGADEQITIEWDPVPSTNIVAYNIYRFTMSGRDAQDPEDLEPHELAELEPLHTVTGEPPATMFTDTTVERYRHYWYRVDAVDSEGNTGFRSVEVHFRTVASEGPPTPHTPAENPWQGDTCRECHQMHAAPGPRLLKFYPEGTSEAELCWTCHDGTGSRYNVQREYTDDPVSYHMVSHGEVEGDFSCVDCHTPHGATAQTPKLLSVDGVTEGNYICYGSGCHGPEDPWMPEPLPGQSFTPEEFDFEAAFEGSAHNEIPDPESGTGIKCSTCHQPHASPNQWLWTSDSYRGCVQCHGPENGVDLASPDVYTRMTLSSDADTSHNVLARNQDDGSFMACQHCHNTHAVTEEKPLVDPWNPGILAEYQWDEGRDAPLAVPDNSPDEPRFNQFCISCHRLDSEGDALLPQLEDTWPWVDPPLDAGSLEKDIGEDWDDRVHGRQTLNNPQASLDPIMGYEHDSTLSCLACHEPHGTANNYNLRQDVPALDGSFPKDNMLLATSTKVQGEAAMYDTRFFCGACHLNEDIRAAGGSHTATQAGNDKTMRWFPNGCTRSDCHVHGTSQRRRF